MKKNDIIERGFIQLIKNRIDEDLDAIIIVEGKEGTGKSSLAVKLGYELDISFSLDNIIYSMDIATNLIYSLSPGSVIIWDEACYDMSRRDAMTKTNKQIIKMAMATRSRNLIHLVCIPHIEDLETYIAERRACYTLSVFMRGKTRGYYNIKFPKLYKNKHGAIKTNWITLFKNMRFKKLPTEIDIEYKNRKEKYSRAKLEDLTGQNSTDNRYNEYKEMKEMGLKDKEIAQKWNITPAAVCQWKKKWGFIK